MNITEFLEARITEDERAAYDLMGERERTTRTIGRSGNCE